MSKLIKFSQIVKIGKLDDRYWQHQKDKLTWLKACSTNNRKWHITSLVCHNKQWLSICGRAIVISFCWAFTEKMAEPVSAWKLFCDCNWSLITMPDAIAMTITMYPIQFRQKTLPYPTFMPFRHEDSIVFYAILT